MTGAVVATVGFASALMTFLPRISIEPPGPFDPAKPLASPFRITNTNFIPVMDGEVRFEICNVFLQAPQEKRHKCQPEVGAKISTLTLLRTTFTRLGMDQKIDVPFGDTLATAPPTKLAAADIIVSVAYHPWFLPWARQADQRFYTRKQPDGQLYWLAIPPDEDPFY
jgi:hypothetical protein